MQGVVLSSKGRRGLSDGSLMLGFALTQQFSLRIYVQSLNGLGHILLQCLLTTVNTARICGYILVTNLG